MDDWGLRNKQHGELLDALKQSKDLEQERELWNRINEINESRDRFPATIADAMNILRHEKIGRWESRFYWADEPQYDHKAKQIGGGRLDREKQDSLYVRLNKNGEVAGTPSHMTQEVAAEARERAERLRRLVEQLIENDVSALIDFEKVESAMKILFASLASKTEP